MLPSGSVTGVPRPEIADLPIAEINYATLMRRDDMRQRVRILVEGKLTDPLFAGLTSDQLDTITLRPEGLNGHVSTRELRKMGLIYTTAKDRHCPSTTWYPTSLAEQLFRLGGLDFISCPARGRLANDQGLKGGFERLMKLFVKVGRRPLRFINVKKILERDQPRGYDGAEVLRQLHMLGLLRLPSKAWQVTPYGNLANGHRRLRVYPSYGAFRYFQESREPSKK
jgi:hypothetical protein